MHADNNNKEANKKTEKKAPVAQLDSVSISINSKRTWADNGGNRRSWSPDMAVHTDYSDRTSPSIKRIRGTIAHQGMSHSQNSNTDRPNAVMQASSYNRLDEESDTDSSDHTNRHHPKASTSQCPTSPRPVHLPRPATRVPSNMSLGGSVVNLAPWEKRFTSTKDVFADFCARTSSHGIPHIGESYTLAGKLFWCFVFIGCFLAFSVQTYWTITSYFEYKTIIEMQLVFEAANFPAVTVCNLNPYKASLVQSIDEIHKSLLVYEQNIVRTRQNKNKPPSNVDGSATTSDSDGVKQSNRKNKGAALPIKRSVDNDQPDASSNNRANIMPSDNILPSLDNTANTLPTSDDYISPLTDHFVNTLPSSDNIVNTLPTSHDNSDTWSSPPVNSANTWANRTNHFYSVIGGLTPASTLADQQWEEEYRKRRELLPPVGRDKRQLVHEPVYATCVCREGRAESCIPHYNQDRSVEMYPEQNAVGEEVEPFVRSGQRTVCMCFESSDNRNAPWPCYPTGRWHEMRCRPTDCDNTRNCMSKKAMLDNQVPKGTETRTCLCQDVSHHCVLEPDDGVIRWFNPKAEFHTATTTSVPHTTTANPSERAALGLEVLNDKGAITTKTKENIMFVVAALDDDIRKNVSYTLNEFVLRCSFNGKDCKMDTDFKLMADPMYGNCYTFNYHKDKNVTNTRGGPMYGLRLLLDVQQKEYLPYTEAAGIRMVVHDPKDEPFPDTFGYSAPVGFISSFGIKMKNIERLGRPYTKCTPFKDKIKGYIYDEHYSSEGCYRNCFQHAVLKKCGCGDPRFPVPDFERPCHAFNPIERQCLANFSQRQSSFHDLPDCECEQPCQEIIYETAYAAAAWPAENFITGECPEELDLNDTAGCTDHYRRNTAYIEVYYEQLTYENLRETQAYSLINLVADFGGNIGLWIGFSVITMIEIVELCIELFYLCYFRRNREEERKRRLKNRLRMRQNLQYLNRFTEFASAAPMAMHSDNDEEGGGHQQVPLRTFNAQDVPDYQLSHAHVLNPSDIE